jgi:hypothetical protein
MSDFEDHATCLSCVLSRGEGTTATSVIFTKIVRSYDGSFRSRTDRESYALEAF